MEYQHSNITISIQWKINNDKKSMYYQELENAIHSVEHFGTDGIDKHGKMSSDKNAANEKNGEKM